MTTRDKRQLHNMLLTVARFQRKSALPDKRSVSAPELNFNAPQYRFEERVQYLISDGLPRDKAEACVKELILKEQPKAAIVGKVVRIEQLIPGQRFRSPSEEEEREFKKQGIPVTVITGVLLYKTPSRARVLLDPNAPEEHSFTKRNGDTVVINSAGRREQNMAPDCTVKVLAETENVALLLQKNEVQSISSSGTKNSKDESEDIMAAKKKAKAAKKSTNGAAETTSKRAAFNAKEIKVLADKNPKREGSASFKRFALYKNGMTVGTFLEKGGTLGDVHYDVSHKHISVS